MTDTGKTDVDWEIKLDSIIHDVSRLVRDDHISLEEGVADNRSRKN